MFVYLESWSHKKTSNHGVGRKEDGHVDLSSKRQRCWCQRTNDHRTGFKDAYGKCQRKTSHTATDSLDDETLPYSCDENSVSEGSFLASLSQSASVPNCSSPKTTENLKRALQDISNISSNTNNKQVKQLCGSVMHLTTSLVNTFAKMLYTILSNDVINKKWFLSIKNCIIETRKSQGKSRYLPQHLFFTIREKEVRSVSAQTARACADGTVFGVAHCTFYSTWFSRKKLQPFVRFDCISLDAILWQKVYNTIDLDSKQSSQKITWPNKSKIYKLTTG